MWSLSRWLDERLALRRMRRAWAAHRTSCAERRAEWLCAEAVSRQRDAGPAGLLLLGLGPGDARAAALALCVLHAAIVGAGDAGESFLVMRAVSAAASGCAARAGAAPPEDVCAACAVLSGLPTPVRRVVYETVERVHAGLGGRREADDLEATPIRDSGRAAKDPMNTADKQLASTHMSAVAREADAHYRRGALVIGLVRVLCAAGAERLSLASADEHLANAAGLLVFKAAAAARLRAQPGGGEHAADAAWDALRHAPDAFAFLARVSSPGAFRLFAVPVRLALLTIEAVLCGGPDSVSRVSPGEAAVVWRDTLGLSEVRAHVSALHARLADLDAPQADAHDDWPMYMAALPPTDDGGGLLGSASLSAIRSSLSGLFRTRSRAGTTVDAGDKPALGASTSTAPLGANTSSAAMGTGTSTAAIITANGTAAIITANGTAAMGTNASSAAMGTNTGAAAVGSANTCTTPLTATRSTTGIGPTGNQAEGRTRSPLGHADRTPAGTRPAGSPLAGSANAARMLTPGMSGVFRTPWPPGASRRTASAYQLFGAAPALPPGTPRAALRPPGTPGPVSRAAMRAVLLGRLAAIGAPGVPPRSRSVTAVPLALSPGALVEMALLSLLGGVFVAAMFVAAQAIFESDSSWAAV